ncbi:hypothetical protein ACFWUQ_04925 [Streptomyces sp. NPDC058662]|uniref:hypothetical protein n=1 Tax=Streptomyces sp. NPDC058662 TaxID=3346583 RepID=UPI0036677EE8
MRRKLASLVLVTAAALAVIATNTGEQTEQQSTNTAVLADPGWSAPKPLAQLDPGWS